MVELASTMNTTGHEAVTTHHFSCVPLFGRLLHQTPPDRRPLRLLFLLSWALLVHRWSTDGPPWTIAAGPKLGIADDWFLRVLPPRVTSSLATNTLGALTRLGAAHLHYPSLGKGPSHSVYPIGGGEILRLGGSVLSD